MKDAKLSAKKRKSLKKGTFCGPNRSFPVPDCKHAKSALSLLGRYKGPGNKASIRACVYRKAKRLGCFKSRESTFEDQAFENEVLFREGMISQEDVFLFLVDHLKDMEMTKAKQALSLFRAGKTAEALRVFRY